METMGQRMSDHPLTLEAPVRFWRFAAFVFAFVAAQLLSTASVHAQSSNFNNLGKEFYVAFGPNLGGEFYEVTNVMDLYITSSVPAHGEVDVPALNFYQTFTTTPGQITTIILPNGNSGATTVELPESLDEQVINGMAVHIKSDTDIAVFGLNHKKWSSDAFMALPINVLGTEYRTINYNSSSDGYPGDALTPGEFWIVAVNDSTNVTITLKDVSSLGTSPNTPINIKLNKGDCYLVEGGEDNESNDLTGSLIESDQPIAVFSGHRRTAIPDTARNADRTPSRDHLVEQLPPVSAWGDSALVVPYATSALPDLVRVVFAEDGTDLTVDGNSVGTFNAGQFFEITHLKGVTSIQASKPIEVGQYMHTSLGGTSHLPPAYGDPAYALVFPVEQFSNSYTIISIINPAAYSGNFVNIVADQSAVSSMTIDGAPISPTEFHNIPNSRFAYAQHQLTQGTHNLSGSKPFGCTVYALGPVDSYSYVGGTLLKTITPLQTVGLVIDFGSRVIGAQDLIPPNYNYPNGTFDTTVYLQNISQDTVNIYSFPKRISDTDHFNVIATTDGAIPGAGLPLTISPLSVDSFTIQFWPHELNRRMHTQITANTDHLRAYVVDVYGEAVIGEGTLFADTAKTIIIDTLDFGIFRPSDIPGDSEVFLANAGLSTLNVVSISTTTHSATAKTPGGLFSEIGTSLRTAVGTSGSVSLPFSIPGSPSGPARINLQFTPTGEPIGTYTDSMIVVVTGVGDTTKNGVQVFDTLIALLIGRVDSIHSIQTLDSITWATTTVCNDSAFIIPIPNPNDIPITLTSATIDGVNVSDFSLSTPTPITIPAGRDTALQVNFSPSANGLRTAQLILNFNLPKNSPPDTIALSGTGDKPLLEMAGDQTVRAYILDNYFLMPIYARTDLTPYGADGYHIYVQYDSVNLQLVDVVPQGTLTPPGYYSIIASTPPGRDTINFQQSGEGSSIAGTKITGGGPTETRPLLYLKFQPVLNGSEDPIDADPNTFQKGFPITFSVLFDDALIPWQCADHLFDSGYAEVGPVCGTQFLEQQPTIPDAMMLGIPTPNPVGSVRTTAGDGSLATTSISIPYDVASMSSIADDAYHAPSTVDGQPVPVNIDLIDPQGVIVRTVVAGGVVPGYYTAKIDAATLPSGIYYLRMAAPGYVRVRNVIVQK